MLYLVLLIFILFLSYWYDYLGNQKGINVSYAIVLIILILIAGLRYRLGVDSIRYESAFQYMPTLFEIQAIDFIKISYDPLYLILSSIARTISDEFWIMQIIQASIVNIFFFRFIRNNTSKIFLAIFFYCIFLYTDYMFETMREACAAVFFLTGYDCLKDRKYVSYILLLLVSFGFHSSAIALIILPILMILGLWNKLVINKFLPIFLLAIVFVGNIIQSQFFEYISLLNLTDNITQKADIYAGSALAGQSLNIFGMIQYCIQYIFFPYLACVILKQHKSLEKDLEHMIVICFAMIAMSFAITIFYRFNNYFYPFAIVAMSNVAYYKKMKISAHQYFRVSSFSSWIILIIIIIYLPIKFSYFSSIPNTSYKEYMRYYPYKSVITKEKDMNREGVFNYYGAY